MVVIRRSATKKRDSFICIEVQLDGSGAALREQVGCLTAKCTEFGASGVEERERSAGALLLIYGPSRAAKSIRQALLAELAGTGRVADAAPVADEDWSHDWQHAHPVIEVSPRLVVRPTFAEFEVSPGQCELIIDPGQAFGTGGHASTLLALEWIDVLCFEAGPAARVLDVGTGTGVLSLASLRLGAERVVACDIDPIAVFEARHWAEHNGLMTGLEVLVGGIDALARTPFDWILANLLSRELWPLVSELPSLLAPDGRLIVSGLLAIERSEVARRFAEVGLALAGERCRADADGVEWIALCLAAKPGEVARKLQLP